jgi:hypothetical protein
VVDEIDHGLWRAAVEDDGGGGASRSLPHACPANACLGPLCGPASLAGIRIVAHTQVPRDVCTFRGFPPSKTGLAQAQDPAALLLALGEQEPSELVFALFAAVVLFGLSREPEDAPPAIAALREAGWRSERAKDRTAD